MREHKKAKARQQLNCLRTTSTYNGCIRVTSVQAIGIQLFIFWDSTCQRVVLLKIKERGSSSIGRVSAFQAEGCEFEARLPLH